MMMHGMFPADIQTRKRGNAMEQPNNNIGHDAKRRVTVERILLIIILFLQATILVWLWREHDLRNTSERMTGSLKGGYPVSDVRRYANNEVTRYPFITPTRKREVVPDFSQLRDAHRVIDEMNYMFESAISDLWRMDPFLNLDDGWETLMVSPTMDMKERDKDYVVVFSLPGIRLSDVTVTLEGRILTIITAVHGEEGGKGEVGRFERAIQLPGPVGDAHLAQAVLTNGILRVLVPKITDGIESSGKRQKLL